MIFPGRKFIGGNVRITARIYNEADSSIDPTSLVFTIKDSRGDSTSYTYDSGDDVAKETVGNYYIDFTPSYSGRHYWRWVATGLGYALAREGSFVVDRSPHFDDEPMDYRTP